MDKGTGEQLVSPDAVIDGKINKVYNAVAIDKSGNIYYSVSSTR